MRAETIAEPSDDNQAAPSEGADETSEWLRKAEAAARLGISERTLDTRLARGLLQKRRKAGGLVEVLVPRLETEVRIDAAGQLMARYGGQLAEQLRPVLELLERERQATRDQAHLIGQLEERTATQAATIEELRERIAALDAARAAPARRWWRIWSRAVR